MKWTNFDFKIKKRYIYKFVRSIQAIADDVRLHFDYNGVQVLSVNPGHVAMVSVELNRQGFERYAMLDDYIAVDVNRLREALEPFRFDDMLTFKVEKTTTRDKDKVSRCDYERHKITIVHDKKTTWFLTLEDADKCTYPEMDLPNSATVENRDLRQLSKLADETVSFNSLENFGTEVTTFDSKDEELNRVYMKVMLNTGDERIPQKARSAFASCYFEEITKALPKNKKLEVRYGDNYPLDLMFERENGIVNGHYTVAPRI